MVFFRRGFYFQLVLRTEETFSGQRIPRPDKKSIRLAKTGGGLPFPVAGIRRFRPAIPFPPRLFAEIKMGDREGFSRPFLASAPAFSPGQQGDRFKRPTKFEGDALNFIIAG